MKLIIIGTGPGGYETAVAAAKKGIEVTIFESADVGGTCLNEGCIPTKALCRHAEILESVRQAQEFGVSPGGVLSGNAGGEEGNDVTTVRGCSPVIDMAKVLERKNAVVSQLRTGVEGLLNNKLIKLVRAGAAFRDAHTVVADGVEYSADYIIIASGSTSASLPIPGAELPGVLTSKEMLDISEVPARLCIIGGGVIGLEFASIFASFGSQVTVIEYCKELLPRFDTDLAKRLKQALVKRGINVITSAQVLAVEDAPLRVTYRCKEETLQVEADKVLMAVGRKARYEGLNLEIAGVETGRRGIAVNEFMQTNVPNIYAIGDVNGLMMLAHAATFQGLKALHHIVGEDDGIDLGIMPAAVFTEPEIGTVGLTEDECKEKGLKIKCLKSFFRANGKALAMGQPDGYSKIICDTGSGRILGCHIMGAHASDLIAEACALIQRKATVAEARDIIHTHPSLSEVLQSALHN